MVGAPRDSEAIWWGHRETVKPYGGGTGAVSRMSEEKNPKSTIRAKRTASKAIHRDRGKAEEGPCDPSRDRAVIGGIE
jgi:hypothetical protein